MSAPPRFEEITETTGIPLTLEGAEMLNTRYAMALELATGKRVLELGCGAGLGFGLLQRSAAALVGGDYSRALLGDARRHYGAQVPLVRLSAEDLPFAEKSFDLVIFFEASYYVQQMGKAFTEIGRVLGTAGAVLFANANPERPDFIRSPYSVHYHTADEFRAALSELGFSVTVYGAFPINPHGGAGGGRGSIRLALWGRRLLERLGLVPRTLRGRARLKRLLYRKLIEAPAEIPEGFAATRSPQSVPPGPVTGFKVIYVQATK
jgi:SAM-dependent methyltransferase